MRVNIKCAAFFLLIVGTFGCGSTRIESVADVQRAKPIGRLEIIVVHHVQIDSSVIDQIVGQIDSVLSTRFDSLNVLTDLQSVVGLGDSLVLENQVVVDVERIQLFDPDALMSIQLVLIGWKASFFGIKELDKLYYDVSLTSEGDDRPFWRGRVSNSGYSQAYEGWLIMGRQIANRIFQRLLDDKVLKSKSLQDRPSG